MKNRSGFMVLATVFIMLVLGLTAVFVGSLYRQDALFAVRNFHSLRSFFVAEAMLSRLTKILENDSDWSDNGPFSVSFAGGTAWGNYMTAEVQTAKVWLVATYEGETRKIIATISKEAGGGLPEAFNYAVFWNNSAGTTSRLRIGWNTDVVGDVGSKGNVRVRSDSSVTGGKIYVAPGYDVLVDPGATVDSWEVSSTMPDFPTVDYSYYDDLITSYEALIPTGPQPNLNWNNSNSPTILSGEVIECRDLTIRQNHVVKGYGTIAARRDIEIRNNATISPEGGSIVFIANRYNDIHTSGIIRNTTAEVDFATIFYSRNQDGDFYNSNMVVQNALIMSKDQIDIFNNPHLGDNTVLYVPASSDSINIHDRPSIEGSVICRGRLRIYGGQFTGLVHNNSSWGTLVDAVSGAFFHGALVSDVFRNRRIQDSQISWNSSYLPPVPPGMSSGSPEVITTSWEEVDYWVTW